MPAEPQPRIVRDVEVFCSGPAHARHPERLLALPPEGIAICEECGERYRRAEDWQHMTRATWPVPR